MSHFFKEIKLSQVCNLIKIVSKTDLPIYEVERIYLESDKSFRETLNFLCDLNIINIKKNTISTTLNVPQISELKLYNNWLYNYLLSTLLSPNCKYFTQVDRYLNKFKFSGGEYVYKSKTSGRLHDSDIRNILIELGYVDYKALNDHYVIASKHIRQFKSTRKKHTLSLNDLLSTQAENKELGSNAEKVVFDYEKKRLANYPNCVSKIEIISSKKANAGYDILSYEEQVSNGTLIERYIEVKAVRPNDYHFYISRNEINTSKKYRNKYYLYLLPVISMSQFDVSNMKIINDPYENIANNGFWASQIESYSYWLKPNN